MRKTKCNFLILIMFSYFVLAISIPTEAQEKEMVSKEKRFADSWFLIQLTAPIKDMLPDGSFPLNTGFPSVDAAIREFEVHKIKAAFPASIKMSLSSERLKKYGLDRTYKFYIPQGSNIIKIVNRFSQIPEAKYAEPDYIGQGGTTPNDIWFEDQWHFLPINAEAAWGTATGEGVVVAIIDTGLHSSHEDAPLSILPGHDFVNDDSDPDDDHGHGSHVGGITSAATNNSIGVAGTCWDCKIMPLKALNSENWGYYSWWADAMVWATDNGARVINLSAGGMDPSTTLYNGVKYAYDAGVIHVSITHNDDANFIRYPGAYGETITIGGTDELDQRADPFCYSPDSGSNYGDEIDVVAPGDWILSIAMGGGYDYMCGTSQAAPIVSGLVGIMQTIYPSVGREEARHLIHSGAEDLVGRPTEDTPGFDIYHGWGRVNMERTVIGTESSISLRVEGKNPTRVFFEANNLLAESYDFIRGDLSSLSESDAGVNLGTVICLENDSLDPDTAGGNEDEGMPSEGEAFFYLGRFNSVAGAGQYGGSSQNRDRLPSTGSCDP